MIVFYRKKKGSVSVWEAGSDRRIGSSHHVDGASLVGLGCIPEADRLPFDAASATKRLTFGPFSVFLFDDAPGIPCQQSPPRTIMAKTARKSATKASLIRTILTAEPKTPTKEVVDALATKGVKVSANHVYLIKSKMKMKKRRQKREKVAATTRSTGMPNPAQAVTKVRMLARELGGLRNLKELVDVLSE